MQLEEAILGRHHSVWFFRGEQRPLDGRTLRGTVWQEMALEGAHSA